MPHDWKIYRTRFLVRAMQLTEPFTFTDSNGRDHHGSPGDYLVESTDGLRIARREIFEDVYAILEPAPNQPGASLDSTQLLFPTSNLPV